MLKYVMLLHTHDSLPSVYSVAQFCSREWYVIFPRLDPEDLGLILLSSGTTLKAVQY